MPTLSQSRLGDLLQPFFPTPGERLLLQLSTFLDLLVKWNQRTNLTAIRDPEQMVLRHFGESLFLSRHLPAHAATLLDLGSGAGFPGIPVQLARPALHVTLAESQHKKAAFLQEAVRTLALPTEVWAGRAEDLPAERRFDVVALRAVDHPAQALSIAATRLTSGGTIAHLTSDPGPAGSGLPLPLRRQSFLVLTPA